MSPSIIKPAVTMLITITTLVNGTPTTHQSFNIIQTKTVSVHRSRWTPYGKTMKNSSFMLVSNCTYSSTVCGSVKMSTDRKY